MDEEKLTPAQEPEAPAEQDAALQAESPIAEPAVLENTQEAEVLLTEQPAEPKKAAPVLCSPLIVHKESDASYQPNAVEDGMTATHTEEELEAPTIERHRFRRRKKRRKGGYVLILLLVAAVAVCAALYFTGTYDFGIRPQESTTKGAQSTETTGETVNYDHVITVKGTYLFYEGQEVDGIEGLISAIKYEPKGSTFTVQDENANSSFLNDNVLATLSLYKMNYNITHIVSSGLTARAETSTKKVKKDKTKEKATDKNQQAEKIDSADD